MTRITTKILPLCVLFVWVLAACNMPGKLPGILPTPSSPARPQPTEAVPAGIATSPPEETAVPVRRLTICMGQEPGSLFLYGDVSLAARNIRQAITDDPMALVNSPYEAGILEKVPDLSSGEITFDSVSVRPGEILADAMGDLVLLGEGVVYFPPGCNDFSCVATYAGTEPVQVEQQVIRYRLRDGLTWSDGAPLRADDSRYSYEVAQAIYPSARADILPFTNSYHAIDERTLEWRGAPGYRTARILQPFFSPIPRHAWGEIAAKDLSSAEVAARKPVSYGPYVIKEWAAGDHLSLAKNTSYFWIAEGLPVFDELTYRFAGSQEAAIAAFQAGECDILDDTLYLENQAGQLKAMQEQGLAAVVSGPASWEHLDFGIASLNSALPPIFQAKETRQAVALCLNRQKLAEAQTPLQSTIPDSFIPPGHPQESASVRQYGFDPAAANALLEAAGWLDADANPATARTSQTLNGITDGTPLTFSLAVAAEDQALAVALKEMLAGCGFELQVQALEAGALVQPGPQGMVFGRNFQTALFSWVYGPQPACQIYASSEIPGNYPQYAKGWGGANITGYSNPEYDRACRVAQRALPGSAEYATAYSAVQNIFAEDLPVVPLFIREKVVLIRAGICGLTTDPGAESSLWNLERIGADCTP